MLWDDRHEPTAILRVPRDQMPSRSLPRVSFCGEDAYGETEEFSRYRVKVKCPVCGIGVMPFIAPLTTRWLNSGAGWVGLDSRTWWSDYLCRCRRGHEFVMHSFTTD